MVNQGIEVNESIISRSLFTVTFSTGEIIDHMRAGIFSSWPEMSSKRADGRVRARGLAKAKAHNKGGAVSSAGLSKSCGMHVIDMVMIFHLIAGTLPERGPPFLDFERMYRTGTIAVLSQMRNQLPFEGCLISAKGRFVLPVGRCSGTSLYARTMENVEDLTPPPKKRNNGDLSNTYNYSVCLRPSCVLHALHMLNDIFNT